MDRYKPMRGFVLLVEGFDKRKAQDSSKNLQRMTLQQITERWLFVVVVLPIFFKVYQNGKDLWYEDTGKEEGTIYRLV